MVSKKWLALSVAVLMGLAPVSFASAADETPSAAQVFKTTAAFVQTASKTDKADSKETAKAPLTAESIKVNPAKWNYDEKNDIYYQIGLVYCTKPAATEYEQLAVYVPGAYMKGTKNQDGTYTAVINDKAKVGNYTAKTAPIVMPVNTGGYAAQKAPSAYYPNGLNTYLSEGFVYVFAGCRGRENGTNPDGTEFVGGAPWGVTDLKAAVRYLRYNDSLIPGSKNRIFTFGHSGGGAQSALMGATGDSDFFGPYLSSIGALMTDAKGKPLSDAIDGAQAWCPITNLTQADFSYEWMMGQYANDGERAYGTWTRAISQDMARNYAAYLNNMQLKDENGNLLTLSQGWDGNGINASGTYYDYMKGVIETSLNHFLSDNKFPLTLGGSDFHMDGGFPGQGPQQRPTSMVPGGKPFPKDTPTEPHTYQTPQDYIDSLNGDDPWITYDAKTNTAKITSIGGFTSRLKKASKGIGAFDSTTLSQAENLLFGNGKVSAMHFDGGMSWLMEHNKDRYSAYADYNDNIRKSYYDEMNNVDSLGVPSIIRQIMYDPMTFILVPNDEEKPSVLANHWRINTGLFQGDTALNTELNLYLGLKQRKDVKDVLFTTVWNQKHTMAERTGNSTGNFIAWVKEVAAKE